MNTIKTQKSKDTKFTITKKAKEIIKKLNINLDDYETDKKIITEDLVKGLLNNKKQLSEA